MACVPTGSQIYTAPCVWQPRGVSMDLEEVEFLGGEGRIVAIAEAPASRRKYNKGRVIPTNSIRILGGMEIAEAGGGELTGGGRPKRKGAGRRFLLQVPDVTRVAPWASSARIRFTAASGYRPETYTFSKRLTVIEGSG